MTPLAIVCEQSFHCYSIGREQTRILAFEDMCPCQKGLDRSASGLYPGETSFLGTRLLEYHSRGRIRRCLPLHFAGLKQLAPQEIKGTRRLLARTLSPPFAGNFAGARFCDRNDESFDIPVTISILVGII